MDNLSYSSIWSQGAERWGFKGPPDPELLREIQAVRFDAEDGAVAAVAGAELGPTFPLFVSSFFNSSGNGNLLRV